MLVPGPWRDAKAVVSALHAQGIVATVGLDGTVSADALRVEVVSDANLAAGFSWGRQGPVTESLVQAVGSCNHAAVLECSHLLNAAPARVAAIGRALRDAGGVAIRMEASGLASDWASWLARMDSGTPYDVFASAVALSQDSDGTLFTCGMHQFDLPDAEIAASSPPEGVEWLETFCVYQVEEDPELASGHTFRPRAEAERRSFERWPDHRHHPDDGRHNPFGLWRFLSPGDPGLEAGGLVPTIIPSLVAVLSAAEGKKGRPLSRDELQTLVSNCPAIAMNPRDARALERSRGYADIEPERAWEQWQIIRQTM